MRARLTIVAFLLSAALTACGGGEADDPAPDSSSEPAPGTASDGVTPSVPTQTPEPSDPAAYLPVPDGVLLTAPGTELSLRQRAVAAWNPRQGLTGVLDVTVTRIEVAPVETSLAEFDIDDVPTGTAAYFVSAKVVNRGETDLGGRQVPLYVVDTDQALVAPTGVGQGFDACPGSVLPAIFAPGDAARSCLIFLVVPGSDLESVMFRPPEGVVPLTWSGKVTELGDRGKAGKGGKAGKAGKAGKDDKTDKDDKADKGDKGDDTPTDVDAG